MNTWTFNEIGQGMKLTLLNDSKTLKIEFSTSEGNCSG